ncbi:MAG: hypothetical protein WCF12_02875 [Propionicimonas sp.]
MHRIISLVVTAVVTLTVLSTTIAASAHGESISSVPASTGSRLATTTMAQHTSSALAGSAGGMLLLGVGSVFASARRREERRRVIQLPVTVAIPAPRAATPVSYFWSRGEEALVSRVPVAAP